MLQSKDTFSQINKIYSVLIPGRPTGNPGSEIVPQYSSSKIPGGGEEDFAYERGGDAGRKFWIKPLKETGLGVAQALFDP